jgi:hypothetical protein
MPEKRAAKIAAEVARQLSEADANDRAFAADRASLIARHAGRYAVYRRQQCEMVCDTFIEAMQHLLRSGGFPGSIHDITTAAEPSLLRRKPPLI